MRFRSRPDRRDELLRLRRGRGLIFRPKARGEVFVRRNGAGTVAGGVEQREEPAQTTFIVRSKTDRATPRGDLLQK